MKIVCFAVVAFFIAIQEQTNGAVVRKQPAFAKPVFSNSYLPAAMQVIFHAVDQLKHLENEEAEESLLSSSTTTTSLPTTSPHAPGQHQPESQESTSSSTESEVLADSELPTESTAAAEISTALVESTTATVVVSETSVEVSTATVVVSEAPVEVSTATVVASETPVLTYENKEEISKVKPQVIDEATAAIEAETPEENYGTPETNHEISEKVHEMAESNQEMAEKGGDEETSVGNDGESDVSLTTALPKEELVENSSEEDADEKSSSEESKEKNNEKNSSEESKEESNESKSISSKESKEEEADSAEEEDDEIRFTLIGEKVAQVPRPSLSNYLRKSTKSPLRNSVEELAGLYDALSKDARKQGLAKFSGYSDEVLKTLETSAEGGIGPQLQTLLEKAVIRNELTREDTKIKLNSTLNKLVDPSTCLSRDLRRLIPLRYIP